MTLDAGLQALLALCAILLLYGSENSRIVLTLAVTGTAVGLIRYLGKPGVSPGPTTSALTVSWNVLALPLVGIEAVGLFGMPGPRTLTVLVAAWLTYLLTVIRTRAGDRSTACSPGSHRVNALRHLIIAFLATSVSLIALETIARPVLPAFPYEIRADPDSPASNVFVPDSEVGHTLFPGFRGRYLHREFRGLPVHINAHGFRDRPWEEAPPKSERSLRLLALGDSFTFGTGVRGDETFLRKLEQSDEMNDRVWTFNSAVPGYGPCDEAVVLERHAGQVAPDIVVMAVYPANDLEDCVLSVRRRECLTPATAFSERDDSTRGCSTMEPSSAPRRIHVHGVLRRVTSGRYWEQSSRIGSVAGPLIRSLLERAGWLDPEAVYNIFFIRSSARQPSPDIELSFGLVFDAVEHVDRFCRERGVRFVAMIVPPLAVVDRRMFDNIFRYRQRLRREDFSPDVLHETLKHGLEERGVLVLDLIKPFRERFARDAVLYYREGHWNAAGHAVAALELETLLRSRDWLP